MEERKKLLIADYEALVCALLRHIIRFDDLNLALAGEVHDGTALLRAVMERFADVRQLQLVTDDTKKTLAFYHSLGLRELSAFGCRGFMR